MADLKISALGAAAGLTGAELVELIQGGVNVQSTTGAIATFVSKPFFDNAALIKNFADPTKLAIFSAAGITTATTRTYILPDFNGTLATLAGTETFTNKSGNISMWTNDAGYLTSFSGAWLLASGGSATGNNTVNFGATGTSPFTFTIIADNLAATQTSGRGILFRNTTVAINGTQQNSPSITWEGRGFGTIGSVNQAVAFTSYVLPVQGTTNPSGYLNFGYSINGAAYTTILQLGTGADIITLPTSGITGYLGSDGTGFYLGHNSNNRNFSIGVGNGSSVLRNHLVLTNTGNVSIGSTSDLAKFYVVQTALSSSWIPTIKFISGNDTAKTVATEFPDMIFGGASGDVNTAVSTRTSTWLAGTVATQRSNYFKGTVLTGASATATFTNAYTVFIDAHTVGANATITNSWSLGLAGNMSIAGSILYHTGGSSFQLGSSTSALFMYSSNVNRISWGTSGILNFVNGPSTLTGAWVTYTQTVVSSGTPRLLDIIGGAHTGIVASVEAVDINYALNRTVQFATGALATQRAFIIQAPTYAFVGASTITTAVTFEITGAPIAGTNAVFTNSYAARILTGGISGKGLLIKANVGQVQAANLFETQDSSGNMLNRFDGQGNITFSPSSVTSGSPGPGFIFNGAAHTGLTASTELPDFNINITRAVQFATGAIALQRGVIVGNPQYSFVGASTITDAVSFEVVGTPTAGTNATITRAWSARFIGNVAISTNLYIGSSTIAPLSSLDVGGSVGYQITSVSANTTLDATYFTVKVDATGAARTITLPAAAGCARRIYIIKKIDSSANTVTIDPNAAELIDGVATKVVSTQYAGFMLQSDGTGWNIIASF